jgi:hypothetical protein
MSENKTKYEVAYTASNDQEFWFKVCAKLELLNEKYPEMTGGVGYLSRIEKGKLKRFYYIGIRLTRFVQLIIDETTNQNEVLEALEGAL